MAGSAGLASRPLRLPSREGVSLGLLVAAAGALAAGAAASGRLLIRDGHEGATPGWVTGPLSGLDVHLTAHDVALLFVVMWAGYAAVLCSPVRLTQRTLLLAVVAVVAAFSLAPPLLSADVFSYIDYGRLGAAHGLDPYVATPSLRPHDPVYAFLGWRYVPSVYGPLFTLTTYPLALVSVPFALWMLKAMGGLAAVACCVVIARLARTLGRDPARAVAVFGLNPVVLVWAVGGAHNDLWMLAAMLAGLLLVARRERAAGGAALAAAVAIKATAGLALPFALAGVRGRRPVGAGFAAAAALAVTAAVVAFPDHAVHLLENLRTEDSRVAIHGLPNAVARLAGAPILPSVALPLLSAAALAVIALLLSRAWAGGDWVRLLGWALLAVVLLSPWFLPWYTTWPLAVAAVCADRRLLLGTVGLQAYAALVWGGGFLGH